MSSRPPDADPDREVAVRDTGADALGGQPEPPVPRSHRDADFSRAVLEDLYRYPRKRLTIAYILWATTGLMGGHRFYLDRTGSGLAMLFTMGGAGFWSFVDLFLIRRMTRAYNEDQAHRKATGKPPRALSFMPDLDGATLPPVPEWAEKRSGHGRLVGDVIVLIIAGIGLGAFSQRFGNYEPIIAVVALIAITLLGARWEALAHMPILRGFDRWNHRLRLFYFTNDPGGPLSLAFRQVLVLFAFFRKRVRAEAKLYLQLGAWFTIIFTAFDVLQAVSFGGGGISGINLGVFFLDVFQTFLTVYAFATPIGAILTTHLLLERRDWLIWALSAVALVSIAIGIGGRLS